MSRALLTRTPSPYPDESPLGYLLRLSEANGYEGYGYLIRLVEAKPNYVATVGWDFVKLQTLFGNRPVVPPGFGYRARGKYVRGRTCLLGKPVSPDNLSVFRARICPHCVRESGYVPAYWDLKAYLACHVHGFMMLQVCSECGKRVKYDRLGVRECRCGNDLAEERTEVAAEELVAIAEILSALVTGRRNDASEAVKLGWPVEYLLSCDLETFCRMCTVLANLHVDIGKGKQRPNKASEIFASLHMVGQVFSDWPARLHRFSSEWHGFCLRQGKCPRVFQSCFSWGFVRLHKNLRRAKAQTNFLMLELLRYGYQHWSAKPIRVREQGLKSVNATKRFGSYTDAAIRLGLPKHTVVRWLKDGRLPAVSLIGKPRRPGWLVDMRALAELKVSQWPGVSARTAARSIGVPYKVYAELVRAGDIPSKHLTNFKATASREDLGAFVSAVIDATSPARSNCGLHSLGKFLAANVAPGVKAQIIRDIRDGALEAVHVGSPRIGSIYTKNNILGLTRASSKQAGDGRIGIYEACRRYQISFGEARAIFVELLDKKPSPGPLRLDAQKVEDYLKRNVPLRIAARRCGIDSRTIRHRARNNASCRYIFSLPTGIESTASKSVACSWFVKAENGERAKEIVMAACA